MEALAKAVDKLGTNLKSVWRGLRDAKGDQAGGA
jgi:hypothetical protein